MTPKRRTFIKQAIGLGTAAATSSLLGGCGSDNEAQQQGSTTAINLRLNNDLKLSPQSHFSSLNDSERQALTNVLENILSNPSAQAHRSHDDQLYAISHFSHKMQIAPTQQSNSPIFASSPIIANSSHSYTVDFDHNVDTFSVQMIYSKKVYQNYDDDYASDYISQEISPQDIDQIVTSKPPKYALSFLFLVLPDTDNDTQTITISDPVRETVKALFFQAQPFRSISLDNLRKAVALFDNVFTDKNPSLLVNAIKSVPTDSWYRYQYSIATDSEGNETPLLRTTDSDDQNGDPIFKIGDPIYTYPMREIFDSFYHDDIQRLLKAFAEDSDLHTVLLPAASAPSNAPLKNFLRQRLRSSYGSVDYSTSNTASLESEGVDFSLNSVDADGLHVTCTNAFNRHVSVFISYLDANNEVLPIASETIMKEIAYDEMLAQNIKNNETYNAIGMAILSPQNTFFHIPLSDSKKNLTIYLPEDAETVRFFYATLGAQPSSVQANNPFILDSIYTNMLRAAEAMTIAFELAIPTFFTIMGAKTISDPAVLKKLIIKLGEQFALAVAAFYINNPNISFVDALPKMAIKAGDILLQSSVDIAILIAGELTAAQTEDSLPIVGVAMRLLNISYNALLLDLTTSEILISKPLSSVNVTRKHTLKLQIESDVKNANFPDGITHYTYALAFDQAEASISDPITWDQSLVGSHTDPNSDRTISTYDISIPNTPAVGSVNVTVKLYIGNWIAAVGHLPDISNLKDTTYPIQTVQNLIPLSTKSIYTQYAKLQHSNSGYNWDIVQSGQTLPAPAIPSDSPNINFSITVNDPIGAIGFSYRNTDTNTYFAKNVSAVLASPKKGIKSQQADQPLQLVYNMLTSDGTHQQYLLDQQSDRAYVRAITISPKSSNFAVVNTKNVGIFIHSKPIDQVAFSPKKGVMAGLSTQSGILQIMYLLPEPIDDSDTNRYRNSHSIPKTTLVSTLDATSINVQYLYKPILLTMSELGDIIILEQTSNNQARLKAFGLHGHGLSNYEGFNNGSGTFTLKKESLTVTYLDIGIESKGYIYILKRVGSNTADNSSYILDLYNPFATSADKLIASTTGISSSNMTVDYWRQVYTLNYETNDLGEPTVSLWVPPVPQS